MKRFGKVQLALAGAAPVFAFIADRWCPPAKPWIAIVSIALALVDAAFIETAAKSTQQAAALIQEEFDCGVLGLPWAKKLRADPEEVHALAMAYAKKYGEKDKAIGDWYPAVVDALPLEQARLICQRSNVWWDAELRHGVWRLYLAGLIALSIAAMGWALAKNLRADEIMLGLASLVPAGSQLLRKLLAHKDAASEAESAKKQIDQIWMRMSRREIPLPELDREGAPLQEEIYQRRRTAPEVPDWLYQMKKKSYEAQMNEAAKRMVEEALRAPPAAG